ADTHGAATDNRGGLDVTHRSVLGQTVDLGSQTFGKEGVYQGRALGGYQALAKQLALALEAFFQRQGEGGLNGGDAALGREQTRGLLFDLGALGSDQRSIVHACELVGALAGTARTLAFGDQLLGNGQAG